MTVTDGEVVLQQRRLSNQNWIGELEAAQLAGRGVALLFGAGVSVPSGVPIISELQRGYFAELLARGALPLLPRVGDAPRRYGFDFPAGTAWPDKKAEAAGGVIRWHPQLDGWPRPRALDAEGMPARQAFTDTHPLKRDKPLPSEAFPTGVKERVGLPNMLRRHLLEAHAAAGSWQALLQWVARLPAPISGADPALPGELTDLQTSAVDAIFQTIALDARPGLEFKMLSSLADVLRIRTALTTNFDPLYERAFADDDRQLSIFDVPQEAGLPSAESVLGRRQALVKMHGGLYGLRADHSLYDEPSLDDRRNFTAYVYGTPIPPPQWERVLACAGSEPLRSPQDLLVLGVSGSDPRINRMIHVAMEVLGDAKLFWVAFSEADRLKAAEEFSSLGDRLRVTRASSTGLLLLQLYYRIAKSLPPRGVEFPTVWHLPSPPRPLALFAEGSSRRLENEELVKKIETGLRRVRSSHDPLAGPPRKGQRMIHLHASRHRSEKHLSPDLPVSLDMHSAAALVFRRLGDPPKPGKEGHNPDAPVEWAQTVWLELGETLDSQDAVERLIAAIYKKRARPDLEWSVSSRLDEPGAWREAVLEALEAPVLTDGGGLKRILSDDPWVLFVDAAGLPDVNLDQNPTGPLHRKPESGKYAEFFDFLHTLSNPREKAPRCVNGPVVVLLTRDTEVAGSARPFDHGGVQLLPRVETIREEKRRAKETKTQRRAFISKCRVRIDVSSLKAAPRTLSQIFDRHLKGEGNAYLLGGLIGGGEAPLEVLWKSLYAISEMRIARYPASLTLWPVFGSLIVEQGDASRDEGRERENVVTRMLDQLVALGWLRRKPAGLVWMHTDVKRYIRHFMAKDAENRVGTNEPQHGAWLRDPEHPFPASVHQALADWYAKLMVSSGDPQALFESMHHRLESAARALEAQGLPLQRTPEEEAKSDFGVLKARLKRLHKATLGGTVKEGADDRLRAVSQLTEAEMTLRLGRSVLLSRGDTPGTCRRLSAFLHEDWVPFAEFLAGSLGLHRGKQSLTEEEAAKVILANRYASDLIFHLGELRREVVFAALRLAQEVADPSRMQRRAKQWACKLNDPSNPSAFCLFPPEKGKTTTGQFNHPFARKVFDRVWAAGRSHLGRRDPLGVESLFAAHEAACSQGFTGPRRLTSARKSLGVVLRKLTYERTEMLGAPAPHLHAWWHPEDASLPGCRALANLFGLGKVGLSSKRVHQRLSRLDGHAIAEARRFGGRVGWHLSRSRRELELFVRVLRRLMEVHTDLAELAHARRRYLQNEPGEHGFEAWRDHLTVASLAYHAASEAARFIHRSQRSHYVKEQVRLRTLYAKVLAALHEAAESKRRFNEASAFNTHQSTPAQQNHAFALSISRAQACTIRCRLSSDVADHPMITLRKDLLGSVGVAWSDVNRQSTRDLALDRGDRQRNLALLSDARQWLAEAERLGGGGRKNVHWHAQLLLCRVRIHAYRSLCLFGAEPPLLLHFTRSRTIGDSPGAPTAIAAAGQLRTTLRHDLLLPAQALRCLCTIALVLEAQWETGEGEIAVGLRPRLRDQCLQCLDTIDALAIDLHKRVDLWKQEDGRLGPVDPEVLNFAERTADSVAPLGRPGMDRNGDAQAPWARFRGRVIRGFVDVPTGL